MSRTPLTSRGFELLKKELKRLKTEERRKVVQAIEEARAHGDLSENAEYDAAKNAQGLLEARIRVLESKIAEAQVIDVSRLSGEKVVFGATVQVFDCGADRQMSVTIVGEEESDADRGLISVTSPLARALIGKEVGDFVEVKLPGGEKDLEILGVAFSEPEVRLKSFSVAR